MGAWQYDDTDLERLSMIMTLHDVGFGNDEIETYMKLLLEQEGAEAQRLRMLDQKRGRTLDEIHVRKSSWSGWTICAAASADSDRADRRAKLSK